MLKKNFEINILYKYLSEVCEIYSDSSINYYIFDNTSYKKLYYHNIISNFIDEIEPYYINSKKYYIKRDLDYNKFLTIIRQICKFVGINYYSKINYDKSKYFIKYYIQIINSN